MKKISFIESLAVFTVWLAIMLLPMVLIPHLVKLTLLESVMQGVSWPIVAAAGFLLVYSFIRSNHLTIGLTKPTLHRSWIIYFPIFVILFTLTGIMSGKPLNGVHAGWILLNSFFAGISEELMFRGFLLIGAVRRMKFIYAVILISVLFGVVHVANGFITGDFGLSALQALMASFSGLLFLAIRIKTKSIIPAILVHGAFDFVVFGNLLSTQGGGQLTLLQTITGLILALAPVVFGITAIIQLSQSQAQKEFIQTQPVEH